VSSPDRGAYGWRAGGSGSADGGIPSPEPRE
jgi:hypothetical protein